MPVNKKMKKFIKKYYFVFLIFFVIVIDQGSKYLIRHYDEFYICNPGISFGFLMPNFVFYSIVGIFFLVSFLYLWRKINVKSFFIDKNGLSLILGGAIANLIDRYNYGCIIDFIDFAILPVFNLADIFITLGAIIIIIRTSKK